MRNFWENNEWEGADRHLSQVKSMPFQRQFPFIPANKGLYIIRGPRQVGKSSWLKTILSHHAKTKKCFYLSCEEVEDFKALGEILRSVSDREVVLLDEVNFIDGWDRAVKHAVDSGLTNILVITGSHSHDLRKGADRMPGRFDGGGEFELLPMGFDEFSDARAQAGWHSGERLTELRAYFKCGGFPGSVAESGAAGVIPKEAMATYWRWLSGDAIKLGKSELLLTEVMIQIAKTMQTPISFNTLAKKTSIGSHNTAREYVEILESCFALRTLHGIDIDTGALRLRKDHKFYFTDPLLYWVALDLAGGKHPLDTEARIAEMVAHECLRRRYRRFGYHSNASGEVDFVSPGSWAIEVKWSPVADNLSKTYLRLAIPQKTVWTERNFLLELPQ